MTTAAMLSRVVAERRRILVPLTIAAVANVAVYALLVYPLSLKVTASERQAAAARARVTAARRDEQAARSALSRAEQADQDLRRFYGETLPATLEAARRMSYARLAELADEHGLIIARRNYDLDASHRGSLSRLKIFMALSGEYQDIRSFIHDLETGPEFLIIETLALSEGAAPGEPLSITVQLATYFARPSGGT